MLHRHVLNSQRGHCNSLTVPCASQSGCSHHCLELAAESGKIMCTAPQWSFKCIADELFMFEIVFRILLNNLLLLQFWFYCQVWSIFLFGRGGGIVSKSKGNWLLSFYISINQINSFSSPVVAIDILRMVLSKTYHVGWSAWLNL